MKRIVIKNGWFYSAGSKYGWDKIYTRPGVGVNLDTLKENSEVELVVKDRLYLLDCLRARAFIREYRSLEKHKGTLVGIVSKSLLREVNPPDEEVIQKFSPIEPPPFLQSKLF